MNEESIRVLLVDDDEDDFVLIRDLLSGATAGHEPVSRSFELEWVSTYEDALEAIGLALHDAYLLDYRLGERDGLDLLKAAIAGGCRAPIIMLTGWGDHEVDAASLREGAADYLDKGEITAPLLARAIRHAIERRWTVDALQESEQLLRKVIDTVPAGIFVKDRDGNFILANESFAQVLGTTPEQIAGTNERGYSVYPPSVLAGFLEDDREVVNSRQPKVIREAFSPGPDGTARWFHTVKVPLTARGDPDCVLGVTVDFTERKQVELRLREAERRFRALLDGVQLVAVGLDIDGDVAYANPYLLEITGHAPDQVMGKNWFENFIPERHRPAVGTVFREILGSGITPQYENPIVTRDGEERLIAWNNTLLFDEVGQPVGTMSIGEDVTDRVEAERALEQRERYFRTLLYSLHEDILVIDRDYRITDVNNTVLRATGFTRDEAVGQCCFTLSHGLERPCDRHGVSCGLREVFETGEPCNCVHEHRCADGSKVYVDIIFSPVGDEQGQVTHVVEAVRDISDVMEAQIALQESEDLLHSVINAVPAGIFVKDRDANYILANEFHANIYGTTPEQMVGTNERDYSVYPPSVLAGFLEDDWQVIDSKQRRTIPAAFSPGPDGTTRWFHTEKVPLTVRGNPDCVLAVSVDITERVRAERALREAEERLRHQERLAAIGQLAGGIAHDFNNYLTIITLGAQVSLRKPYLPPDLKRTFEGTLEASRRAATLVQQLLDFSRRSLVDIKPLELSSWLKGFSYVLRRTLPENIEVTVQRQGDDYVVDVDQGRIQQALMNLATNARDAMPEGGELRIDLSRMVVHPDEKPPAPGMDSGEWICLAISDTGTGMTADAHAHLYEPFFTTKEVGKGTGLGLPQVHGIVLQHRGHIDVETEPGQGTTFRIFLPAHTREVEAVAEEQPVLLRRGKGETILLVEDEDGLREVGQEILESLSYQVLTAAHGREALAVFQSAGGVDLVITDMVMPQMGGKALMQELRRQHPGQKGLIITGYALKEDLAALRDAGIVDTVPKPFDVETLARVVRRALDED